jgi:uncharacterized protein YtpQ (UPF0354 family)
MMKKNIIFTIVITMSIFKLFGQNPKSTVEKEFNKTVSKIYPVIKVKVIGNNSNEIKFKDEDEPIFKNIAGDLLCFYGIDKGEHFSLLLKKQLPENIDLAKLDSIATENLKRDFLEKINANGTNFGGIGLSCGGDNEAALITISKVFEIMKGELGENLVFAVPSKDLLVFVNGNNPKDVQGLLEMVTEVHKEGERLLSKKLYIYKDGKIIEK